jgi:hypothetical protein
LEIKLKALAFNFTWLKGLMTTCILPSNEACNEWIDKYIYENKCTHIGFDTESRSSSAVLALIQIATPFSVMIYRVYEIPPQAWPVKLVQILEDPGITKYCVDIRQDIHLLNNLGLKPQNIIDLQIEAIKYLNINQRLGFKTLLKTILKVDFNKSKSIQRSNWSKLPLTQKQIEYACDDAIGCLALAEEMKLCERSILDTSHWKSKYFTKFITPFNPKSRLEQLESVLVNIIKKPSKEFNLVKNAQGYIPLKAIMNIPELYFTLSDVECIIAIHNTFQLQSLEDQLYIR